MKTKADIINFLEAEEKLGFITEKIADRLKWYFDTYFIERDIPDEPNQELKVGDKTRYGIIEEFVEKDGVKMMRSNNPYGTWPIEPR